MNVYALAVNQPRHMLRNLDAWLDAGAAHAAEIGYDVNNLLAARLAPDMFPLTRQVQAACDASKFLAARLAGADAPSHPDTETTFDEVKARVATVIAYLDTFDEAAFDGAMDRMVYFPAIKSDVPAGFYLCQFALPNLYFHLTTAYDILRHNGVKLGKRDFLGATRT